MKKTPLYQNHVELGAQMVDFGGYLMPVRYVSEKNEHMAVRNAAGLFDVSHMGEILLLGEKASAAADLLLTNQVTNAQPGQAVYGAMLNEAAGIVDDVVIYKFSDEKILFCVNASNRYKDFEWMKKVVASNYSSEEVSIVDESDGFAQLALQGPLAEQILRVIAQIDLQKIGKFRFCETSISIGDKKIETIVARTGYTGEDGFEIFTSPKDASLLWESLIEIGTPLGLLPCGLSARDTLRLEAGMCLYGNDIDDSTTPLEAGIGWAVKWQKDTPFFAHAELLSKKEAGLSKKLVGLKLSERNIARAGYTIFDELGNEIGKITSGTLSPTLQIPIALGYVKKAFAEAGSKVYVEIRKNKSLATVVKIPFYKKTA